MEDVIFNIEFSYDGKSYKGIVHPSEQLNEGGIPVSFHVILNEKDFGELTFQDCKWSADEKRSAAIIRQVGKQIEKHYQF